jgi:hypothetical protein
MTTFARTFFDPQARFQTIGGGALGGKAGGLALANGVLADRKFAVDVSIPSLTVLGTEVFGEFVSRNDVGADGDEAIARAFQRGDLPPRIVGDLRALIEQVKTPLAVRSSALHEDELAHPSAGAYLTKMIPNNQPSPDDRFRRLVEAIKLVWASARFHGGTEPMAVILQEVVGTRFGDRFYPQVSGVARSWNFYPSGNARPDEGLTSLALGLGKTIVDGGVCWTYSPAWPTAPAPFSSPQELMQSTQTDFWAVHMGKPPEYDPLRETEYMVQARLADAEDDGTLRRIASTFDRASAQIRMGTGTPGPRVLDFAPLLALREPPLNDVVRELLAIFAGELGTPVEIEFAMTFDPHRFAFLQVRPMNVSSAVVEVSEDELADALVSSTRVLGNGTIDGVRDVISVKKAERLDTRAIARDLARLNREVESCVLIGFGRWGSSDPSLGTPVVWRDIDRVRALVEATTPSMNVEPSQGSHFFHNLSAAGVPVFTVPMHGRARIGWEQLDRATLVNETPHVRHVRFEEPLTIRVDGRTGRGVIRAADDDRNTGLRAAGPPASGRPEETS